MLTTIPALLYFLSTLVLFGMTCFFWGYFKGADIRYIEIVRERKEETK
jgi:hypothetical protein